MRIMNFDQVEAQSIANQAAHLMIQTLHRDGIFKHDPDELCKKYVVVLAEPSWFGKIFEKLFGEHKPNTMNIHIAKL